VPIHEAVVDCPAPVGPAADPAAESRSHLPASAGSDDVVSVDERLRYLRYLRALFAALTVIDAVLQPAVLRLPFPTVVECAAAYLVVCLLGEAVWRVRRRGRAVFGGLLLFDGVYLAWAASLTGGSVSALRYAILVHLVGVTLLASYRTGVRLAVWHSLLQVVLFYAERTAVLPGRAGAAPPAEWHRLVAFVVALWALTATVASLAAVSERELRRRRYEVEQLAQMGRALEDAVDPLGVGEVLLDTLADTFGFERMALFELPDEGPPRLLTFRGLRDARVDDLRIGPGSVVAAARADRRTLLVDGLDPAADAWLAGLLPRARNLVVLPLVADAVVGVLVAETGGRSGNRGERRLVATTTERFAGHAALTMRNAYLLHRMSQLAVTDGLTELANRRSFDRALDRELQRAVRTDGRLSVVLLDIDHFKQLNDTYGHVTGDEVLRQVAHALRACGREYDTVARYGGEEFAAVLPGCSTSLALEVAERLRRAVEEAATDVPVTASAGVATFPYDGIDVNGLLAAADQALYASKHAGRNRVSSAEQARAGLGS
jgi:diguanylate cyclase (GGDEF)-like protein